LFTVNTGPDVSCELAAANRQAGIASDIRQTLDACRSNSLAVSPVLSTKNSPAVGNLARIRSGQNQPPEDRRILKRVPGSSSRSTMTHGGSMHRSELRMSDS